MNQTIPAFSCFCTLVSINSACPTKQPIDGGGIEEGWGDGSILSPCQLTHGKGNLASLFLGPAWFAWLMGTSMASANSWEQWTALNLFFETKFHNVGYSGLELTVSCLSLPMAGITGTGPCRFYSRKTCDECIAVRM